jgi:hypothetical protein
MYPWRSYTSYSGLFCADHDILILFLASNGSYLIDSHVADPLVDTVKSWAISSFEAERLWKMSEELVDQEFTY